MTKSTISKSPEMDNEEYYYQSENRQRSVYYTDNLAEEISRFAEKDRRSVSKWVEKQLIQVVLQEREREKSSERD